MILFESIIDGIRDFLVEQQITAVREIIGMLQMSRPVVAHSG